MALGPFARVAAQAIVAGIAVLSRALPAAYAQALNNAKKGGGAAAAKDGGFMARKVMSRDEALNVLNLTEAEVTAEAVQKVRPREGESWFENEAVVSVGGVGSFNALVDHRR